MGRFYVPIAGADPAAVRAGFLWALKQSGQALLAVPQLSTLDGVIEGIIGPEAVKALRKQRTIQSGKCVLKLATEREHPPSWIERVLAIYPSPKLLDYVDGLPASEILVVFWREDHLKRWASTWSALPLGSPSATSTPAATIDPVVRSALESLSARVNPSTGLGHPDDRSSAVELFERLRDARIRYEPAEVRTWLVGQGGWKPEHANEVEEVCRKVLEGKNLKADRGRWRPDVVEHWRKAASAHGTPRP